MKIILSRKGFDSANGGIVSPIMEDGTLISFPIPSEDKNTYEDLVYGGQSYTKILEDLKFKGDPNCHIDPDLSDDRRKTPIDEWCPVFGQINSSAAYLIDRVKVEPGDFYSDNDLQLIWGYLQVGKIITDPEEQRKYSWHPHSDKDRINGQCNVMFMASETLSFNDKMAGAGVLSRLHLHIARR